MLQMSFSEEEKQALHYERFHHPHPRVQRRMEALWLKSHDLPHNLIAKLVQVDEDTVRSYLRAYQEGRIEKLKELNWRGPASELGEHTDTLANFFRNIRRRLWLRRAPKSPS